MEHLLNIIINTGLFPPLIIVTCIASYLCILRPFTSHYIPGLGMLKRMGLSLLLSLLSAMTFFSMDTALHIKQKSVACMFSYYRSYQYSLFSTHQPTLSQNPYFLIIQLVLTAFSDMLTYTAVFEFICSQSPHSMKGLLIGLLYAIKGLYQVLAGLLIVPFAVGPLKSANPSCGSYYYLTTIILGGLGTLVFVYVSRKYRYRERDEYYDIHRYAEEY